MNINNVILEETIIETINPLSILLISIVFILAFITRKKMYELHTYILVSTVFFTIINVFLTINNTRKSNLILSLLFMLFTLFMVFLKTGIFLKLKEKETKIDKYKLFSDLNFTVLLCLISNVGVGITGYFSKIADLPYVLIIFIVDSILFSLLLFNKNKSEKDLLDKTKEKDKTK